jgi:1-acyl-sn-glycerol-3-phosphate acyltransferase
MLSAFPVRRLVIAPLLVLVELAIVIASPVALLVAVLVSPLVGGRAVRMVLIVLAFVLGHLRAVGDCLAVWLRRGGERDHYEVMRAFVARVYGAIVRLARVEVRISDSAAAEELLASGRRPVVVLGRHAGQGDTLLVVHDLLCRYDRRPRVVMHERLRLDPVIDVLGSRLPNRFVDPHGGDTEVEIAAMARDAGGRDAVLIFPEGANFTAHHRRRAIERLERAGHEEEAAWAREMRHVSAPRPGGALAAIEAAPDADVVVMGYVGFPCSLADVWAQLAHPQAVEVRMWLERAQDIPSERDAAIDWLFARWRTLDAWIDERQDGR